MRPKNTARVIVTYQCNRSCPGCCNTHDNSVKKIEDIHELFNYDEIVITGGEPMLLGNKIRDFVINLRISGYSGRTYLYTALWEDKRMHHEVIKAVNGITFTIHAEAYDADVIALKSLSKQHRLNELEFSSRLIIDSRVYEKYDFSNIDLTNWDVIRKLQWKDECQPAEHEELLYFPL